MHFHAPPTHSPTLNDRAPSDDNVLPADDVREVLAALYAGTGKFKVGDIDDATECLEAILQSVHCESVGQAASAGGDEAVCNPPCPACAVFRVAYFDMPSCSVCGSSGDMKDASEYLYRVWVHEVLTGGPVGETFEECLRRAWVTEATVGGVEGHGASCACYFSLLQSPALHPAPVLCPPPPPLLPPRERPQRGAILYPLFLPNVPSRDNCLRGSRGCTGARGPGRGALSGPRAVLLRRAGGAGALVREQARAADGQPGVGLQPAPGAGHPPRSGRAALLGGPRRRLHRPRRPPARGHPRHRPARGRPRRQDPLRAPRRWPAAAAPLSLPLPVLLVVLLCWWCFLNAASCTPPLPPLPPAPAAAGGWADAVVPAHKKPGDTIKVNVRPVQAVAAGRGAPGHLYRLCGMICYYGKHYVSLFARRVRDPAAPGHGEWLCFDDDAIRPFESWREAKRCTGGGGGRPHFYLLPQWA